jgi:hypothetical protein
VNSKQNPTNLRHAQVDGIHSDLVSKYHMVVIDWGDGTVRQN